jgi:flavin reductase (DIM6/NTAB) family NADH-FMN oxidoreductase RutF
VSVSSDQFRDALRFWASGVSIVTTRRDGGIQGITVSSFCSLSLDPPLVVVCIAKDAASHPLIERGRCFAVNILKAGQRRIADLAAGRSGARGNRLEGLEHRTAVSGAPVLGDCLAWLDCTLFAAFDGGDHTIFVGRVVAAGQAEGRPLLWFGSAYHALPAPRRPRRRKTRRTHST